MTQYIPANAALEEPKLLLTFPAGLNENQTPDIGEASAGYNFELGARQSKLIPRAPFDLKGSIPGGTPINGLCQLVKRSTGTVTTLVGSGATMYQWNDNGTFTSKGSITNGAKLRDIYWSLGDYIIMTDVSSTTANVVTMWDGTTFQTMPTGLGSPFSAKYAVVFNSRVWFFNITSAGVNTPHMIVASAFENPQSLNISSRGGPTNLGGTTFATGLEAFYLLVPDLKAINGVSVFQNILVISTKDGQLFKLTGTNAADYQFTSFYTGSAAVGTECMVNIGNDVGYIRKGGNINLMRSVQAFGDVKSNDIARWIPNTTKDINDAISVYDQTKQKVYFFNSSKVLVLFKDILYGAETDSAINQGLSPWSVYVTDHPSSFNTSAAKYMVVPNGAFEYIGMTWFNNQGNSLTWSNNSGNAITWSSVTGVAQTSIAYSVYFGDSVGNIYDLNGTGIADAGLYPVRVSRTSRVVDETIINPFPWNEEVLLGKVQYRRISNPSSLNISFQWTDEYNTSTCSVTLKGPPTGNTGAVYNGGSYYGKAYYSTGFLYSSVLSHQNFSPTGKGSGFYITLGNQGASQWQVDHLLLY